MAQREKRGEFEQVVLLTFPHQGESPYIVGLHEKIQARLGRLTLISGQRQFKPSRIEGSRDLLAGRSVALLKLSPLTRTYEGLWGDLCEDYEGALKRGDGP